MARTPEDPNSRRERLLKAAHEMLEEDGASSLSMRALAARTKTSPMSVYELFGSKDGLIVALLQYYQVKFAEKLSNSSKDSSLDKFFESVEIACSIISNSFNYYQAHAFQYFSPSGEEVRNAFHPRRNALITRFLEGMVSEGYQCSVDISTLTDQIEGVYISALFNVMIVGGDRSQLVNHYGLGSALLIKGAFDRSMSDKIDKYIEKFSI